MNTYKLINFQFIRIFQKAIFLFLAFVIMEFVAFLITASNVENINLNFYRFEQVLEKANIGIIFTLFFVATLLCIIGSIFELYMGSKSIYSIVQLPVSPSKVYLSFLIAGVLNIMILACLQLIMAIIFGLLLPNFFSSGITFKYMSEYISLAFIRSKSLSFLFPLSIVQLLQSIIIIISPVIVVIFACFAILSKRYSCFITIMVWTVLYLQLSGAELVNNFIVTPIILIILSAIMIDFSIDYIESRCIL